MKRIGILEIVLFVPWIAGMYASARLSTADVAWTHSICGPWGCGPPTQAVVGMHLFWLLLIGGCMTGVRRAASAEMSWRLGTLLLFGGLAATIAIVGVDFMSWLPQTAGASNRYLMQRGLFVIATSVDIPAMQCVLTGGILVLWLRKRRITQRLATAASTAAAASSQGA